MSNETFHILIMDRNPHVRDFLTREFRRLGFTARTAKDEQDVAEVMRSERPAHLVVFDPEAPGVLKEPLFAKLTSEHPAVPIVVHMFSADNADQTVYRQAAAVVEKDGSIESLVQAVIKVLAQRYSKNSTAH